MRDNREADVRELLETSARQLQRAIRVAEERGALLAACKAQQEAIGLLFALLVGRTRHDPRPFVPDMSGQPWEAIKQGDAAIIKAEVP